MEFYQIVEKQGAGDAFVGAFAHFLNRTKSKELAVDLAAQYATITCKSFGTQSSYPAIAKLEAHFHV